MEVRVIPARLLTTLEEREDVLQAEVEGSHRYHIEQMRVLRGYLTPRGLSSEPWRRDWDYERGDSTGRASSPATL